MADTDSLQGDGREKRGSGPVLPALPDHASGAGCSLDDGLDRMDKDFMRTKLDAAVESGEIFEDGWRLVSRAYKIPYLFASHNNLELIAPDGRMFASLDTQQIERGTGKIKVYFPDGGFAAPVVDDCTKGNMIVHKENLLGETVIVQGRGTEALLGFARATEAADSYISAGNYTYRVFPDQDEHEANSNSLARAFAEVAASRDIYANMVKYAKEPLAGSPGLDVDLIRDATGVRTRYDRVTDPDMIVLNTGLYERFLADMKALHPVSQQERALGAGPEASGTLREPAGGGSPAF